MGTFGKGPLLVFGFECEKLELVSLKGVRSAMLTLLVSDCSLSFFPSVLESSSREEVSPDSTVATVWLRGLRRFWGGANFGAFGSWLSLF